MEAAKGLLDKFVGGVKSAVAAVVGAGAWIVNRIVEGVKTMGAAIGEAAGWVKNRVVDGIHAAVGGFLSLGGWIVNRIVDGIKVIGEALASVGGWLKNRVVDTVHAAIEGFTGLGGWVLNRIVDGFKIVSDALTGVGGWLKNRVVEAFELAKDGFLGAGKSLMGWIVDGLKSGANLLVKFVNKIISIIEDIPGVGKLPRVKEFAEGGKVTASTGAAAGATTKGREFARGGFFAKTGGYMNSPVALGGEEAPKHAEWVIPENPAYRSRALGLWQAAGQSLGATGFAEGGVVSAFRSAIDRTNANPKPSLALWEAGIVESGLRNLPYGDRDSLGALQVRAGIHGRDLAMDPLRSALAFLTRGFTGAGGAIALSHSDRSAGQVAQAVQGSAFPDRYDQAREQALKFMGDAGHEGGGPLGVVGDALGAVGGVLGDLVSKGAGFLLDKLPGVGDLPDWLKGTGKFVLGKAGDWIKDKVAGLVGGGSGGGGGGGALPPGITDEIKGAIAYSRTIGNWTFGPGQLFRPGGTTYHGQGRAVDFGDAGHSAAEMRKLYGGLKGRYGSHIKELFYDPMGEHVKNGRTVGNPFGGHGDHVHLALAQGGKFGGILGSYANGTDYVPRTGPYMLHRGEGVTPAAQNGAPLEVVVTFDGLPVELQKLVKVEVKRNGDEFAATWKAGQR